MLRPLYAFLFVVLLSVAGCDSTPGESQAPSLAESLQDALNELQTTHSLKGVSAAVVLDGTLAWRGVSGESLTPDHLFGIASITKNYVAAVTLVLVDEGLLSLDAPISTWLPDLENINGSATLRQILNHTSGTFNYTDSDLFRDDLFRDPSKDWSADQILAFISPPSFAPGQGWSYSNTGYLLAGMIIEQVTGESLSRALRSRLFEPLGLQATFLVSEEVVAGTWAAPWTELDGDGVLDDISSMPKQSLYSAAWAAGGLAATAADVARWGSALFEGRVFSEATLNEMLSNNPVGQSHINAYGLGTVFFSPVGGRVGHTGDITGFGSILIHDPDLSATIVVLVNQEFGDKLALVDPLLEVIRSQ